MTRGYGNVGTGGAPTYNHLYAGKPRRTELTDLQKEFLEWLVDPNKQGTQEQWAKAHGVAVKTPYNWKKESIFRKAWEDRAYELSGGPERVTAVIDKLFEKATVDGDVKAMQLYLQYVDKFTPKRQVETVSKQLADLSDEELAAMGDNIARLRKQA